MRHRTPDPEPLNADERRILELRERPGADRLYRPTTFAGRPDVGTPQPIRPALWTCEACRNLNDQTSPSCELCGRARQARRGAL